MEYKEVKFPNSDPVILEAIRLTFPGILSPNTPISWEYVDSGDRIGLTVFYGNCGSGTTLWKEDHKEEFRSILKVLRRSNKIKQIEDERLDKIS
jgi:hypothetical protein